MPTKTAYIIRSTPKEGETKETRFFWTAKSIDDAMKSHNNGSCKETRTGGPYQLAISIEGLQNPHNLQQILNSVGHHYDFERHLKEVKHQDPNFPTHTEARASKLILALIKTFQQKQEDPATVAVNLIQPLPDRPKSTPKNKRRQSSKNAKLTNPNNQMPENYSAPSKLP